MVSNVRFRSAAHTLHTRTHTCTHTLARSLAYTHTRAHEHTVQSHTSGFMRQSTRSTVWQPRSQSQHGNPGLSLSLTTQVSVSVQQPRSQSQADNLGLSLSLTTHVSVSA